ncbi:hypothetical protein AOLI_G00310020 [Acnodon oligacanthus]
MCSFSTPTGGDTSAVTSNGTTPPPPHLPDDGHNDDQLNTVIGDTKTTQAMHTIYHLHHLLTTSYGKADFRDPQPFPQSQPPIKELGEAATLKQNFLITCSTSKKETSSSSNRKAASLSTSTPPPPLKGKRREACKAS